MAEPRAQRTLVKSPPELWAEVSDAASLAKRLGEFGEIRITRLEPETTVVWEGERASGTVKLEPSGWGTKVTLTAMPMEAPPAPEGPSAGPATDAPENGLGEQDAPEPAAVAVAEPPRATEPEPVVEATPVAEPEPLAIAEPEPEPEPVAIAVPEPEPEPVAIAVPEPERGFFARLFGRRARRAMVEVEPPVAVEPPAAETPTPTPPPPAPPPPAPPVEPIPDPIPPPTPQPPAPEPDPVPPPTIEALDEDHVVGVLTSALDDLGAAHHRPFSR
jgi:hypothetical protein